MLLAALALAAQPLPPHIAIIGRGNGSCEQWSAHLQAGRETPERIADVAWLEGYLSGINVASHWGNAASTRDIAEVTALVDSRCAERPQDQVVLVVGAVIMARRRRVET